ncbi:MAG: TonB family protein [Xanthomarina sp.]
MTKLENRLRLIKGAFLTFLFLLNFFSVAIYAQESDKKENKSDVLSYVEKMPQYPGGQDAMSKFISDNIVYPKQTIKEGRVFVTFIVRKNGKITDVSVLRGFDEYYDNECVRLVKMMPNWIPGEQNGKKMNVQFVLPIKISMSN